MLFNKLSRCKILWVHLTAIIIILFSMKYTTIWMLHENEIS